MENIYLFTPPTSFLSSPDMADVGEVNHERITQHAPGHIPIKPKCVFLQAGDWWKKKLFLGKTSV